MKRGCYARDHMVVWSIYNYMYLCNQYLSPLMLWVRIRNPAHGEVYSIQLYVIKFVSDFDRVGIFFLGNHPAHGEVYLIQHYVIKFVSDLHRVGSFFLGSPLPPPIKLLHWHNWNIVESGVKHHNHKAGLTVNHLFTDWRKQLVVVFWRK